VGPLKETANGNKYIGVAKEYLTRWPEARWQTTGTNISTLFSLGTVYIQILSGDIVPVSKQKSHR